MITLENGQSMRDFCRENGLNFNSVYQYMKRNNVPPEEACRYALDKKELQDSAKVLQAIYTQNSDVILSFERAYAGNHVLVPRTSLFRKTAEKLTEQEKADMIILLEQAKELFK